MTLFNEGKILIAASIIIPNEGRNSCILLSLMFTYKFNAKKMILQPKFQIIV